MKVCIKCKILKEDQKFYTRSGTKFQSWCKSCFNHYIWLRVTARKLKVVKHLGGKCQHCGYSKCLGALELHHVDRTKKSATVRRMGGWSWERVLKEIQNCLLLCANCHREEEERIRAQNIDYGDSMYRIEPIMSTQWK